MPAAPEAAYFYVHVDVPPEQNEDASFLLFEAGAQGVEERDNSTLARARSTERVTLVASFPDEKTARQVCSELDPGWNPRVDAIVGDAWRDAWKEHFRPFLLSPRVLVCPPWETAPAPSAAAHRLELEPGRAFGTGLHATTSLVAGVLDVSAEVYAGKTVLDVGTGSGILSLVALLLGAERAVAVDNDPEAVEVARENAARNGLAHRLLASTTSLNDLEDRYAFVVANIETRVLVPMATQLRAKVANNGWLVLSGILVSQENEIRRAFAPLASQTEVHRSGEWSCFVLRT